MIATFQTEWVAPIVLALKNARKLRFFVNYCRLKAASNKRFFPIPCMEEFIDYIREPTVFYLSSQIGATGKLKLRDQIVTKEPFTSNHRPIVLYACILDYVKVTALYNVQSLSYYKQLNVNSPSYTSKISWSFTIHQQNTSSMCVGYTSSPTTKKWGLNTKVSIFYGNSCLRRTIHSTKATSNRVTYYIRNTPH